MAETHHHNTGLLLGLAAAVGLYWYMKHRGSAATLPPAAPAGQTAIPGTATLNNPLGLTALPPTTDGTGAAVPGQQLPVPSATVQVVNPVALALPYGMDPNVWSVVQKWAQTDGRAPVLNMAAAGIISEYAGMYDIIVNAWDAGVPVNAQQTAFWDALRAKYDPTHAVW
jgi:hypothetical protein